jgi:toxin ParE1/3/4
MELIIAPSAQVDLLSIWEYVSRRDIEKANALLDSFKEAFDLLVTFPEMGREREGSPRGVLSFSHEGYLVFYRLSANLVEVIRVLHSTRDYAGIFRDS